MTEVTGKAGISRLPEIAAEAEVGDGRSVGSARGRRGPKVGNGGLRTRGVVDTPTMAEVTDVATVADVSDVARVAGASDGAKVAVASDEARVAVVSDGARVAVVSDVVMVVDISKMGKVAEASTLVGVSVVLEVAKTSFGGGGGGLRISKPMAANKSARSGGACSISSVWTPTKRHSPWRAWSIFARCSSNSRNRLRVGRRSLSSKSWNMGRAVGIISLDMEWENCLGTDL